MKPITPVVPGFDLPVTEFGKTQPEYQPLPAVVCEDQRRTIVTRWRLSFWERLIVLLSGSIWLSVLTFGKPLQPVKMDTQCPIMGHTGYDPEI